MNFRFAAALLVTAGLFFVGGRWSAPQVEPVVSEPPRPATAPLGTGNDGRPAAPLAASPPSPAREPAAPSTTVGERRAAPDVNGVALAADAAPPSTAPCDVQLQTLRASVKTEAEQRLVDEGTPVASAPKDLEPRFGQEQLRSSLQQAFAQSKVPGGFGDNLDRRIRAAPRRCGAP